MSEVLLNGRKVHNIEYERKEVKNGPAILEAEV